MGDCALPWFVLGSAGPGLLLCWLCWVGGGEAGWLARLSCVSFLYSVLIPSCPFLRHTHLHVCARNVSRGGDGDRPCGSPACSPLVCRCADR